MRIILICAIFLHQFCFANARELPNIDFFSRFNDQYLPLYIQKAIENNHNLKEAEYRINRFRYEIKKEFSYELPELSALPGYFGVHFPNNDYNIFIKNNAFILPLKVSFEPDILLKNYDKIKKSKADYSAQIAKRNNTYISLLSNVAGAYINILLYDFLIENKNRILKNGNSMFNKENAKYIYGIADKNDLNNVSNDLMENEIDLYNLIKKRNTLICDFRTLTGNSCDNKEILSRGTLNDLSYTETIPEIISSDLIYQRPDIIEIENQLKSAKFDITIAKKNFLPKFDITGFLVFDTTGKGNFFSWSSSFALLLANATADLFQGGRKIADLKIKKEKFNELMETYKERDLTAIKEVNNALNLIRQDTKTENKNKTSFKLENDNLYLAQKKLNNGIMSELDYLKNKNKMLLKKQDLLTSKAVKLIDYITLYKALGGNL